MPTTSAELLDAALKLSPAEREELAERLLDSLPHNRDVDGMTDDELKAELDRRHAEALADPSVLIPWEEVQGR
jgi:putative addiction module component (TIGR02574 family)